MSDFEEEEKRGDNGREFNLEAFLEDEEDQELDKEEKDRFEFEEEAAVSAEEGERENLESFFTSEVTATEGKIKKSKKSGQITMLDSDKEEQEEEGGKSSKKKTQISDNLRNSAHQHVQDIIEKKIKLDEMVDEKPVKDKEETIKAFVISSTLMMRNPYHYQNYIKLYILCLLTRAQKIAKFAAFDSLIGLVISKMDYNDIKVLDLIRRGIKARRDANKKGEIQSASDGNKTEFEQDILVLCRALIKYFCYRKFNNSSLLANLARHSGSHTYEQILQIFVALCRYVGMNARIVFLLDLRALNLDKKHKIVVSGLKHTGKKAVGKKDGKKDSKKEQEQKELTAAQKKRRRDQMVRNFDAGLEDIDGVDDAEKLVEEVHQTKKQKQPMKMTKKNLQKMIARASSMIIEENDSVVADSAEIAQNQAKDAGAEVFENKLTEFIFDNPKIKKSGSNTFDKKSSKDGEETKASGKASKKSLSYFSEGTQKILDTEIESYSFSKSSRKSDKTEKDMRCTYYHENFHSELKSDDHDSSNFKCWVEVFDEDSNKWVHVDPLAKIVYKTKEEINKKLINMPGLFVVSFIPYNLAKPYHDSKLKRHHELYMKDLTAKYMPRWHKVLVSRRQVGLHIWWEQVLKYFGFEKDISSTKERLINAIEEEEMAEICKKDVPQNVREFRVSKHYIIPSLLKKFQGFKRDATPLPIMFKDENIYLKDQIEELHSRTGWMRKGRKVRKTEQPVKRIVSVVDTDEKLVDLYGEWQTDVYENRIGDDGSLPRNEYGNYELWHDQIPLGTAYVQELPGLVRLCKKLGVEFLECVVGFEKSKGGKSHPIKGGVLVHQRDEAVVREAYEQHKEMLIKKEAEKQRKGVITLWKQVFKKILVKKYVEQTYMHS